MRRLLVAEVTDLLGKTIQKQLQNSIHTEICHDSDTALERLSSFEPDILLLDLQLPGLDCLSLLRSIRSSGRTTKVIVIGNYISDHELQILERLNVSYVFRKPCSLASLLICIRELENTDDGCLELEADRLLLSLGMHMGRTAYQCAFDALCMKFRNYESAVTKEIYPQIAKKYGGNVKQVEKAIRDAIKTAWSRGNPNIWRLYFSPGKNGEMRCPGNDEFLSRLARALLYNQNLKLPYEPMEKAQ